MAKTIDLTGQRFGRLYVESFAEYRRSKSGHKDAYWNCVCDCGTHKVMSSGRLKAGTQSCGCYRKEANHNRLFIGGRKLGGVYRMMKARCYDKDNPFYHNYGGRGISMCGEWLGDNGRKNFRLWALSSGYAEGVTLERIDNDKGYSPDNCTWVTRKEQSNNKRNNIVVEWDGEKKTLTQWCEKYGVPYSRVRVRYVNMGWSFEDAMFTPRYGQKGEVANV